MSEINSKQDQLLCLANDCLQKTNALIESMSHLRRYAIILGRGRKDAKIYLENSLFLTRDVLAPGLYEELLKSLETFRQCLVRDRSALLRLQEQDDRPHHIKRVHDSPDGWILVHEKDNATASVKVEAGRLVSAAIVLDTHETHTTWTQAAYRHPIRDQLFGQYRQYIDESSWTCVAPNTFVATIKPGSFPASPEELGNSED